MFTIMNFYLNQTTHEVVAPALIRNYVPYITTLSLRSTGEGLFSIGLGSEVWLASWTRGQICC